MLDSTEHEMYSTQNLLKSQQAIKHLRVSMYLHVYMFKLNLVNDSLFSLFQLNEQLKFHAKGTFSQCRPSVAKFWQMTILLTPYPVFDK